MSNTTTTSSIDYGPNDLPLVSFSSNLSLALTNSNSGSALMTSSQLSSDQSLALTTATAQKPLSPATHPLNCPNCPPLSQLATKILQAENEVQKLRNEAMWKWVNSYDKYANNIPDFGEVEDLKNQLAEQKLSHLEEISRLRKELVPAPAPLKKTDAEKSLQMQLAKKQRSHNQERQYLHNLILDLQQSMFLQAMGHQVVLTHKISLLAENGALWNRNVQLASINESLRSRLESRKSPLHIANQQLNEERRCRQKLEKQLQQVDADKNREMSKVRNLKTKVQDLEKKNREDMEKMEVEIQALMSAKNEETKRRMMAEAEMKKRGIKNNVILVLMILMMAFIGLVGYFFTAPEKSSKIFENSIFESHCNISNVSSVDK